MSTRDPADYLSLLEAAKELGVSKSRVEYYVKQGRLAIEWMAEKRVILRTEFARFKAIPRTRRKTKNPLSTNEHLDPIGKLKK